MNNTNRRELRNKPLIEAIFEIRWRLDQVAPGILMDPNYKLNLGRLYEQLKDDYPTYEKLPMAAVPEDMVPYVVQHRFRVGENRWPLTQIGPGILTLNDTENYNWEDFKLRIQKLLKVLEKVLNYTTYERISLTYVNAVDFEYNKDNVLDFLKNNLGIEINVRDGLFKDGIVNRQPVGFDFKVEYPTLEPKGVITLHFEKGWVYNKESLIWSIIVATTGSNVVQNSDEILKWVEKAHELAENWFFTLLDQDFLRRFE